MCPRRHGDIPGRIFSVMSYDASEHVYEIIVLAHIGRVHASVRCVLYQGITCLKNSAEFKVHLTGVS